MCWVWSRRLCNCRAERVYKAIYRLRAQYPFVTPYPGSFAGTPKYVVWSVVRRSPDHPRSQGSNTNLSPHLQQERQAGVAVGDVVPCALPDPSCLLCLHQLHDDATERGQRLVDVHRLLEVLALGLGASQGAALDALAACGWAAVTSQCRRQ